MIYENDDLKFPAEGFAIVATWKSREETPPDPRADGRTLPRKATYRRDDVYSAFLEADRWVKLGYAVIVYQTINLLIFNSSKDIKNG